MSLMTRTTFLPPGGGGGDANALECCILGDEFWFVAPPPLFDAREMRSLPDEWKSLEPDDTVLVSEGGLHALVVLCWKRMPEALPFYEWVCGEVLPALRRRRDAIRLDLPATKLSVEIADLEARSTPMTDQEEKRHAFVLFRKKKKNEAKTDENEYLAIRCQKRHLKISQARIKDPDSYDQVLYYENVPNSVSILVKSKEILKRRGIPYVAWGDNKMRTTAELEDIMRSLLDGDRALSRSLELFPEAPLLPRLALARKTLPDGGGGECWIAIVRQEDHHPEFWFKVRNIGKLLGHEHPDQIIKQNIPASWRRTWGDLRKLPPTRCFKMPSNWKSHSVFVNEAGVHALVLRLKARPDALRFHKWMFGQVLPALRREECVEALRARPKGLNLTRAVARLEDRVAQMTEREPTRHTFVLLRKRKRDDADDTNEYRAIRCQKKNRRQSLMRVKEPDSFESVLCYEDVPNPVNVLLKSKEILKRRGIPYAAWGGNRIRTTAELEQIVAAIMNGDHMLSTSLQQTL